MIDSYSNYDLKETKASSVSSTKRLKSTDEPSLNTKSDDDIDSNFNSEDSNESHGSFISNDDDYIAVNVKKDVVPVMITASRENVDDDGCIHSEFNGHDNAISEVYEEYKESSFGTDEVGFYQEYVDCTYDTCALY